MDLLEAIEQRHSVRAYTDQAIEGETLDQLNQLIDECNRTSGLSIQLCLNEPKAFTKGMARYGRFENVKNYIALVGKKNDAFEATCGYYGEKLVLKAQQLGLNSCWVALTFSKRNSAAIIKPGEKQLMVIALGYGVTNGAPRKTKTIEELSRVDSPMPEWFESGMKAVQLAPTAMNQQKFCFALAGDTVSITPGSGFYTKTDLGIAKYHFEIGSGKQLA